jgi:Ca2+/H+ antiporter
MPSLPDADDAATTAPSGGGGLSRAGLIVVPVAALVVLVLEWGRDLPTWLAVLTGLVLAATVLVGVHHAEVVAHRVGEPKGSLVLAIAVTVIEVGLIVSVMSSGKPGSDTLARDTVFAAVMITLNGIVGICLVVASLRTRVVRFTPEGAGAALAAVTTLAVLSLVLPTLTTSAAGPVFTVRSWPSPPSRRWGLAALRGHADPPPPGVVRRAGGHRRGQRGHRRG